MKVFFKLGIYPKTLKLKDLNPGIYNLISLRKIQTKKGVPCIANLDVNDEGQEYFLKRRYGYLPEKVMEKINRGNYTFDYKV